MRVNGVQLNTFQTNLIKELMGDVHMTDVRAEAQLGHLGAKYDVNFAETLSAASKKWEAKNAEFKRLAAEDLAQG